MGRTIAIGDVHGCAREFEKLLKKINTHKSDKLIQLGDLINKGPNSHDAILLARSHKVKLLMGNHELRMINAQINKTSKFLNYYNKKTYKQLKKRDWDYIKKAQKYFYDKELKTIFVHGGFVPNIPWKSQPLEIVTKIQVIDKKGLPQKRTISPKGKIWAKLWKGKEQIIYGHTPRKKIYKTNNTICIDTGCVYGGTLSAYILEEKKVIKVNAKKAYC